MMIVSTRNVDDNALHLDLKLLWKTRQNPAALLCNHNHVFQTHSAQAGIIEARLDREHLPVLQDYLL